MRKTTVAVVAAILLMPALMGADVFKSHSTGDNYLGCWAVTTAHGAVQYFDVADANTPTTTQGDAQILTFLSISNPTAGQVNVRLYGDFGKTSDTGSPWTSYTVIYIAGGSSYTHTNSKVYAVQQMNTTASDVLYIGRN